MIQMNETKSYMLALNLMGKTMRIGDSSQRKKIFQEASETLPNYIGNKLIGNGVKRTFGLTDSHRLKISQAMKKKAQT